MFHDSVGNRKWLVVFVAFALVIAVSLTGAGSSHAEESAEQAAPNVDTESRGLRLKAAASEQEPKKWAVLIGVNEYLDPKIPNLKYCVADAHLMYRTLTERCGYEPDNVLLITDDQEKASHRPLKIVLSNTVDRFLSFVGKNDTVLVYFAGHGFLDEQGRGYLAPQDCDHKNLGLTALRSSELKDALQECKAAQKMLILDCCHAGGERSETVGKSGEELGREFGGARGLLTLASCRKHEFSNEWEAREQGLFTYYLAEALNGAADRDGDRIVDADEAYLYTWNQVRMRALREFGSQQTPVRIIGEDVDGVFAVAHLGEVEAPATVAADKTERPSRTPEKREEENDLRPVYPLAILPFNERGGEVKGLGATVTDLTFAHLSADGSMFLVDREEMQKILDEQELNLSGLVRPDEAIRLGQLTGAKLILTGSVLQVDNRTYLVAKIISTETSRVVGASVNGKAKDELGALVAKLAEQAAETISRESENLVAKPVARDDRVAVIKEKIGDAKRPTLRIDVEEQHVGQNTPDPAAETELTWFAIEAGFPVVDADSGRKLDADILISGEGVSEFSVRRGNLVSVRARLEVKAVDAKTGKVIAIDRQTTVAVGLSEQIAGKLALQDAATEIAERMLPKLVKGK